MEEDTVKLGELSCCPGTKATPWCLERMRKRLPITAKRMEEDWLGIVEMVGDRKFFAVETKDPEKERVYCRC